MKKENKAFLLELARESIKYTLENGKVYKFMNFDKLNNELKNYAATFVTLTIKGNLRGCVGKLLAMQPLYIDVIENAYFAAFEDTRFPQLQLNEYKQINIEISILSKPVKLKYNTVEELLFTLNDKKPGVILLKGIYQATFLPQVWDNLKDPKEFLSELCAKAGLSYDEWKKGGLDISLYSVESFEEKTEIN